MVYRGELYRIELYCVQLISVIVSVLIFNIKHLSLELAWQVQSYSSGIQLMAIIISDWTGGIEFFVQLKMFNEMTVVDVWEEWLGTQGGGGESYCDTVLCCIVLCIVQYSIVQYSTVLYPTMATVLSAVLCRAHGTDVGAGHTVPGWYFRWGGKSASKLNWASMRSTGIILFPYLFTFMLIRILADKKSHLTWNINIDKMGVVCGVGTTEQRLVSETGVGTTEQFTTSHYISISSDQCTLLYWVHFYPPTGKQILFRVSTPPDQKSHKWYFLTNQHIPVNSITPMIPKNISYFKIIHVKCISMLVMNLELDIGRSHISERIGSDKMYLLVYLVDYHVQQSGMTWHGRGEDAKAMNPIFSLGSKRHQGQPFAKGWSVSLLYCQTRHSALLSRLIVDRCLTHTGMMTSHGRFDMEYS